VMKNWFNSMFRRKSSQPVMNAEKSSAAGWHHEAERTGFIVHDTAVTFLAKYYRRQFDVPIQGFDTHWGFVDFDPANVTRFQNPTSSAVLHHLAGKPLCPIGTTSGHTVFLLMDADGASFAADMDGDLFAPLASTTEQLLELLCNGANCRVDSWILDESSKPTGHIIRESNERDFWKCEMLPHVNRYLPSRSLSPLRRPPSWRPMIKASESALAKGGTPSQVMVTNGGFTSDAAGQAYFVAHCENSIYVRNAAGFKVARSPPGVPENLRPGEIVPFTAPRHW
ncbi:MAG: hypothetical protein JWM11_1130, partial [Planctomycetaceae bacterium]|nr:hypothetical protein [Planctomycetaceae bacterium]